MRLVCVDLQGGRSVLAASAPSAVIILAERSRLPTRCGFGSQRSCLLLSPQMLLAKMGTSSGALCRVQQDA